MKIVNENTTRLIEMNVYDIKKKSHELKKGSTMWHASYIVSNLHWKEESIAFIVLIVFMRSVPITIIIPYVLLYWPCWHAKPTFCHRRCHRIQSMFRFREIKLNERKPRRKYTLLLK